MNAVANKKYSSIVSNHTRILHGFTLIELLVVIAIIALLVSILLPSLNKAKDLARRAACMANLHSIGVAIHLYGSDSDGELPPSYNNHYQYYWPIDTIDAIAEYTGGVNENARWGYDADNRYSAIFKCPSVSDFKYYGTGDSIFTSYYLLTMGPTFLRFPANHTIEPPSSFEQSGSKIMTDYPLGSVIVSDTVTWANWNSSWYGNHVSTTEDASQNISNVKSGGTNNLHLDGHCEWNTGSDLTVYLDLSGYAKHCY